MSDPFCDINLSNLLFKPSFSNLFSTGHHQHQKYRQNLVISCTFHILLQHPSAELRLNNKTLNEDHTFLQRTRFYYYWGFLSGHNHASHSEDGEKQVHVPTRLLNLCCSILIIALIVLTSKPTSKIVSNCTNERGITWKKRCTILSESSSLKHL